MLLHFILHSVLIPKKKKKKEEITLKNKCIYVYFKITPTKLLRNKKPENKRLQYEAGSIYNNNKFCIHVVPLME